MAKLIILFLLFPLSLYSQISDSLFMLSSGYNDRNPSSPRFNADAFNIFSDEGFFVFERATGDSVSNIMIQKITFDGASGNPIPITTGNSLNINPSISYKPSMNSSPRIPGYIFIVWQKYENGFWNIKGKYFNHNTGWSEVLDISSDTVNEIVPRTINKDTSNFIITFERDGDIIYREFDAITGNFSAEFNLSEDREPKSDNAFAFHQNGVTTVSFQGHIMDTMPPYFGGWVMIYKESSSPGVWDSTKLLNWNPGSINLGFMNNKEFVYLRRVFGAQRVFKKTISGTEQYPPFQNQFGETDVISYVETDVVITDSFFEVYGFVTSEINDLNYSAKVFWSNQSIERNIFNATGDYKPGMVISEKLRSPTANNCYRNWFIFNDHDLLTAIDPYVSRIAGFQFTNCVTDLTQSNELISGEYQLRQNFPNPFNPTTTISFDIPHTSDVKLTVFDALGRTVATLVNEQLGAGSYNYQFSINKFQLGSGVYFYRLEAGSYSDIKRMILLK